MPAIFDLQGRFVFACEIFTHHNTMLQCNYPTFSWITVNRTEAGDWERVWFVPTPAASTHQGYFFYSHFGNWLKLSGSASPDPVFNSTTSTAVTPPTDALPIFFDPLPERGPNWYGFRFWNGSESRYFQAQPSTADTPLADSTAVSDWEGFQVRTLAITVRANTAAVMQASSATTVGTYTGSVTDTERWEVEQCPFMRTNVYLKSRYYGSYVTFAGGLILLAEKSAGSILVVEKKSGTTTNQVTLKFQINNQYLSAPSTGGLSYSATAGTNESFDIIYA